MSDPPRPFQNLLSSPTLGSMCSWIVVALFLAASGMACEAFLPRDDRGGGDDAEACTVAEACCKELNEAGAYNEVLERAGETNTWPNHCPSWDARQASECGELLEAVANQRAQLEDDHPVFEYENCEQQE